MYYYYPYYQHGYYPFIEGNRYNQHPYHSYDRSFTVNPHDMWRQQTVRGQASWTEGGPVTQCNIPWSHNDYMTAAVGANAPYQCGQMLRVKNITSPDQEEISVMVVDQVPGYPPNNINLHRNAFEALGADPNVGIIQVEITPEEDEENAWGRYLLRIVQTAYTGYDVLDYTRTEETEVSPTQIIETYEYRLQSPEETISVRANITYNPQTNQVVSLDLTEL
ncbi:DUF3889 domain-containing protein [Evansella halocellulosilytica]|uniref:DUF3889 domain-containing protein n=1 Tax=Evansella halocellulosilytica TaxID=2011013 RepID=UPI0011554489|nr:DUF3889 domain-containing protein [Evansella halocellulosilytica]